MTNIHNVLMLLSDVLHSVIQMFSFCVLHEILRPKLRVQNFVLGVELLKFCNTNEHLKNPKHTRQISILQKCA